MKPISHGCRALWNRETNMATYIVLVNFTDQGIRNIKDFPKTVDTVKEMARATGVTLKDRYWTFGTYDLVAIWEAPDDATMAAHRICCPSASGVTSAPRH